MSDLRKEKGEHSSSDTFKLLFLTTTPHNTYKNQPLNILNRCRVGMSTSDKPAAVTVAQEEPLRKPELPSNRLAPYNPTHVTAREKALDLLSLSDNDVLFDLGCGDGRLLFTAMERFYDDDYLMQQHQKIFNSVATTTQQPQHESSSTTEDEIHNTSREGKEVKFNDSTKKIRPSLDNQSQPLIPHMMCNASDDDDEESHGVSFDTPSKMLCVPFNPSLNTPKKSAVSNTMMSPPKTPHAHIMMPTTPTTSNRKIRKNDFPTPHLSPIQNEAISEIQDIPLTITASASNEELNQEDSEETSPSNKKWSLTLSDTRTLSTFSSQTPIGLRCVGIEYDQALVDAANDQIDSFKMYESFDDGNWVKKRLCIRWGCVLDEWNSPDLHCSIDGRMEQPLAQHLSLLEDATAVFVYLLPEGLKKVKPLLLEAARRRRDQIEQLQLEEQLQQNHRRDYSHVSDITDYDFLRTTHGSEAAIEKRTQAIPPAFRVVSYMFSISGWTPSRVDRSSKGGCPLYLYENVTELCDEQGLTE